MDEQDLSRLRQRLAGFLKTHKTELYEITQVSSHVFEAVCFMLFVQYYEHQGLHVTPHNLHSNNAFRFKFTTKGHPWNYSYFTVTSKPNTEALFEIRHNQTVSGAWYDTQDDDAPPLFALDIAVVRPNSLPDLPYGTKADSNRTWLENSHLITFGEAKKLTGYPMLIAQFFGVIHEILPQYTKPRLTVDSLDEAAIDHPPPLLFVSQYLTGGSRRVLLNLHKRNIQLRVIESVDTVTENNAIEQMQGKYEGARIVPKGDKRK